MWVSGLSGMEWWNEWNGNSLDTLIFHLIIYKEMNSKEYTSEHRPPVNKHHPNEMTE